MTNSWVNCQTKHLFISFGNKFAAYCFTGAYFLLYTYFKIVQIFVYLVNRCDFKIPFHKSTNIQYEGRVWYLPLQIVVQLEWISVSVIGCSFLFISHLVKHWFCFFNEVFMSRYQPVVCAVGTAYCTAPEFIFIKHSWICSMLICLIGQFCGPGATRSCYWVRLITLYRCRFLPIKIFIDHCVAPVELHNKTNPRLCMNWSILTSLADPPFPHNLKIPGSKPLQLFISTSCSGTWKEEFSLMLKGVKYISVSSYWLMVFCC